MAFRGALHALSMISTPIFWSMFSHLATMLASCLDAHSSATPPPGYQQCAKNSLDNAFTFACSNGFTANSAGLTYGVTMQKCKWKVGLLFISVWFSVVLTTIPSSTAALVALSASMTRSLFSPTSTSLPPPTWKQHQVAVTMVLFTHEAKRKRDTRG